MKETKGEKGYDRSEDIIDTKKRDIQKGKI